MSEYRHMTYGDPRGGTHWDGCDQQHWNCRITLLEAENKRLRSAGFYDALIETTHDFYDALIETTHESLTAAGHTAEVDGYIPGAINELTAERDALRAEVERLREALEDERTDRQQYEAALSAAGVHVRQNKMFEYEVYLRGEN